MPKEKYRFIEHTADVEYLAYGNSLNELFKNSLLALFDTIAEINALPKEKSKARTLNIRDKASSLEDLLWFTLQDALSIADSEGLFGYGVESIRITGKDGAYNISAAIKAKPKKQGLSKLDVKGVSKFDLKVKKKNNRYKSSVVLDV
ncbi:MAG: archease [Candidatus Marsarchaeota archaeon]|nr:archease [Candidatus Marsarchaeota archaeon]